MLQNINELKSGCRIYGGPEGTTLSTNLNAAIKANSHLTKVNLLQT